MITSKEQIIDYFKSGIKENKNFKIGIEFIKTPHTDFFIGRTMIKHMIQQVLMLFQLRGLKD